MPKPALKLPRVASGQQRRLTLNLDADLSEELDRYRGAYVAEYGGEIDVETLIPNMLRSFMENDRAFKQWKKANPAE